MSLERGGGDKSDGTMAESSCRVRDTAAWSTGVEGAVADDDGRPQQRPEGEEEEQCDRRTTMPHESSSSTPPPSVTNHHHQRLQRQQQQRPSFIQEFAKSKGAPVILVFSMLLALGFGSTVGVVPALMTDRYARLHHGYADARDCSDYNDASMGTTKPEACIEGSAEAQDTVALQQLISNGISFFTSPLVGSLSDEHGRRGILILGVLLSCISPMVLVLMQLETAMSPGWYYAAGSCEGLVNWLPVALSALADVTPASWRAPAFGLLMAGFSLGFAAAPQFALWLGHFRVSVLALCLLVSGLCTVIVFFPETLSPEAAASARARRMEQIDRVSWESGGPRRLLAWRVLRPLRELSIVNKDRILRLLSLLAFFSGLVTAGDQTLLIYYVEERIGFTDKDVAVMLAIIGIMGIFVQGVVLKVLNDAIGERMLVTLCFVLGSLHNLVYGLAHRKASFFAAFVLAAFVAMSFPAISAIKSNHVENSEQGRIQGALSSLSALARATGPLFLRSVYHYTKNGAFLGPGSMFVVAAMLDLVAVGCAYALPEEVDSRKRRSSSTPIAGTDSTSFSDMTETTSASGSGSNDDACQPLV